MERARSAQALVLVLAILPLLISVGWKTLVVRRPFWMHFYDPETIHFYNGLRILRGLPPDNIDNPASTLQMLSALIAALTGPSALRYEAFVVMADLAGLLAMTAGIIVLLLTVLRELPPTLKIVGCWTYYIAPPVLEWSDVWSPETLYLLAGGFAVGAMWRWSRTPSVSAAALTGMALGAAVATKFIFLTWAPGAFAAMLIARRRRDAATLTIATIAGFVASTCFITTDYALMYQRLRYLSSAARGAEASWTVLLESATGWVLWMATIVFTVIVRFDRARMPIYVFASSGIILNFAAAVQNPSYRYVLPCALLFVVLFSVAVTANQPLGRKWRPILVMVATVLVARALALDLHTHHRRIEQLGRIRDAIQAAVPDSATVVYGWRVPIPSFALRIMTSDPRDLRDVETLYPREGHLDWSGAIVLPNGSQGWDYAVVKEQDARWLQPSALITKAEFFVVLRRSGSAASR